MSECWHLAEEESSAILFYFSIWKKDSLPFGSAYPLDFFLALCWLQIVQMNTDIFVPSVPPPSIPLPPPLPFPPTTSCLSPSSTWQVKGMLWLCSSSRGMAKLNKMAAAAESWPEKKERAVGLEDWNL